MGPTPNSIYAVRELPETLYVGLRIIYTLVYPVLSYLCLQVYWVLIMIVSVHVHMA